MDAEIRSIPEFPWAYPESSVVLASGEEGVLGRGSYGEVRRATWCGMQVACKRLHSLGADGSAGSQTKLTEEMSLLATLRHPNLVLFLGVLYDDVTKAPTSILTEMLPYSLYDLLEVHKVRLEVAEVLDVAMDIAQALKYLHSHDPAVVHRDLSSKNVLMGYGRAKVADLGQAKLLEDVNSHAQANTTMPGAMAYSAPEVLTGVYDKSIDVFSFGVLLVQLVTGEFPRIDRRRDQLQAALARCPFLAPVIERCLHLQPQDRPAISDVVVFLNGAMDNPRLYNQEANQCGDVGILAKRSIRHTIDTQLKETRQQLAVSEKRLLAAEGRLKAEMLRADQTSEQLQQRLKSETQLNEQMTTLRQQLATAQSNLDDVWATNQQMARAQQEATETISALKQQLMEQQQAFATANEELKASNTRCSKLQQTLQAVEAEKTDLEQTYAHALKGAEEMRAQLNMQLEATRELDVQLAQTLHRWQAEQLSRTSAEKSLRDAHRTVHSLQTEKAELLDKLKSMQQQIAVYSAETEQKASQESGARLELQDLRRQNAQLERTVERLRADAAEQTKDLEALRAALEHASAQKQELESRELVLKRQQHELSEQVSASKKQLAGLEARCGALQMERDQYRQQLSAMHVIVDSARRHRSQTELDNVLPVAATTSTPVAATPGSELSASSTTGQEDIVSNGSSLALETDRAVKSKVEEAIQQGPKQLLDLMQEEMPDIRLAWRCMRFLKTFAQESLQHREQLADLGVFPVILMALRAHHQMKDMQLEGMKAVAAAVFKSNRCRRLAGEAALPQYACHVLSQFAADATVVAQTCTALTNLTHNSFDNKDRVVEAGGVKNLIAAMERFAVEPKVQTQAAWTLLTLAASDTVAVEIARAGGATCLIDALSRHRSNEQVVYYACWALNNLAACADNQVRHALVHAGIGEACSIVLEQFPHASDIVSFVQFISKQLQQR